jgi:hypothetical protein
MFYILTKHIMPNRDWTWPQWKGPMTWTKMWSCSDAVYGDWKNVPFERGQGKKCWNWMRKWMGNRWSSLAQSEEKPTNEEG